MPLNSKVNNCVAFNLIISHLWENFVKCKQIISWKKSIIVDNVLQYRVKSDWTLTPSEQLFLAISSFTVEEMLVKNQQINIHVCTHV